MTVPKVAFNGMKSSGHPGPIWAGNEVKRIRKGPKASEEMVKKVPEGKEWIRVYKVVRSWINIDITTHVY